MNNTDVTKVFSSEVRVRAASMLGRLFGIGAHRKLSAPVERPPFFIIGSGRSGTTLLRAMLASSPSVHIPPENHAMGQVLREFSRYSWLPWDSVVRLVLSTIEYDATFERFDVSLRQVHQELLDTPLYRQSLSTIIDSVYRYHTSVMKPGAEIWGDKTPLNTRYVDAIGKLFPEGMFIHMLRDGRDVVRSYLQMGRYETIKQASDRWITAVETATSFGAHRPDHYIEVRYEALVANPESVLRGICEQLNIQFTESMLEHQSTARKMEDIRAQSHLANVATPVSSSSVGSWQEYFTSEQKRQLDAFLLPLLRQLSYED